MYMWSAAWIPLRGKDDEAVALLKKACEYANRAMPPVMPWKVYTETFGQGRVCVVGGWNSLADVEGWMRHVSSLADDKEWRAMWKEEASILAPGWNSEVWREA